MKWRAKTQSLKLARSFMVVLDGSFFLGLANLSRFPVCSILGFMTST